MIILGIIIDRTNLNICITHSSFKKAQTRGANSKVGKLVEMPLPPMQGLRDIFLLSTLSFADLL